MRRLWSLVVFTLMILGLIGPRVAGASLFGEAGTRIGGLDVALALSTGGIGFESPGFHLGSERVGYEEASDATLAAGGGPKLFPNLFPEDLPSRVGSFRLEQQGGKWVTVSSSGDVFSAKGRYIFVVQNGETTVARQGAAGGSRPIAGHVDIAGRLPVEYAGEIQFGGTGSRGVLRAWTNGSGHYQPPADFAHQSGLPMDLFQEHVP